MPPELNTKNTKMPSNYSESRRTSESGLQTARQGVRMRHIKTMRFANELSEIATHYTATQGSE